MKKISLTFIGFVFLLVSNAQEAGEKKGWTSADRNPFIRDCVKSASAGMGLDTAKFYCYCMLEKIEVLYPDPVKAADITAETLNSPDWKKMVAACLVGYWSTGDRNDFIVSCVEAAQASIGEEKAKSYCDCMLYKLETKYPKVEDANKITAEQLQSPEWKKMIQGCLD